MFGGATVQHPLSPLRHSARKYSTVLSLAGGRQCARPRWLFNGAHRRTLLSYGFGGVPGPLSGDMNCRAMLMPTRIICN